MLYDRDYMRGSDHRPWRSPVVMLLVVLGVMFLLECFLRVYAGRSLADPFGLSYLGFKRHRYWQLLTYQFLHTAPWPWHIVFNGLALWFFGRPVLEAIGATRFWQVYLGSGVIGGLLQVAVQAWIPNYPPWPTVGASASVMGIIGTYCLLHPAQETVFFLYVLPVRLRSIVLFWVLFAFSLFGAVFPYGPVAHAAHLGGLLAGASFARWLVQAEPPAWWLRLKERRESTRKLARVTVGRARSARDTPAADTPPTASETREDFMRREVDPILDKINAHGFQSLTERELRILQKARERMRER